MRLKPFQQQLKKKKITHTLFVVLEAINPSFVYFTQLPKLTHAALLIPSQGKPTLFVSILDYGRVKHSGMHVILLKKSLFDLLKKHKLKSIGLDFQNTPYSLIKKIKKTLPKVKLADVSSLLAEQRIVKTDAEVELLAKAADISNKAFMHIISHFDFKTEAEVAAALEYEMAKQGASPAFPTIVASGKNASIPHHVTTNKPLQRGFCVIDFGASYNGYCSDCTRTIFIGKPTPKEKNIYNLVLTAQKKALAAVKINNSCKAIDSIARNQLKNYGRYFTHALGHGIGIEVHEAPSVSQKSKDKLQKMMAITIEPGIYVPNKFGIRIEDTVIVGNKPRVLTTLSKILITIC